MTSRFDDCLAITLGQEGGYSNDPADHGGATLWGVSQATYDAARTDHGQPHRPVAQMTRDEMRDIYLRSYWIPVHGDQLERPLDMVVFDTAVNCGVRQAIRFLQRSLSVRDDGDIGPVTLEALANDQDARQHRYLAGDILRQRENFYVMLVTRNPDQQKFLRGWQNRCSALRDKVMGD